jgi:anti-sigma regulatory factor (Ser/Thr protein kinase)/ActR/RegA family two-component response regulator
VLVGDVAAGTAWSDGSEPGSRDEARPLDEARHELASAGCERRVLAVGEASEFGWLHDMVPSGVDLHFCHGTADALRQLGTLSYDVLVATQGDSPDEDLARLGAFREARPGLRVILLSAERRQDAVIDAIRHDVFAYFSAPFDRDEVRSMIRRALEADERCNAITLLSASRQWLAVRVSSRLLTAERLVQFMKELRTDLDDPDRDDLMLAFREVLLNAMEHGAGFDPEKVVEVHAVRTARSLIFCFRDPGPGFRGRPLPHAAISYEPGDALSHTEHRADVGMRPGGFGILLARHYADELIWNEAGNELIMVKHLD